MAIEDIGSDIAAAAYTVSPLTPRERLPEEDAAEKQKVSEAAVTPSIRPSDDAVRALFEERNEDLAVGAAVVAQRYQIVQESQKTEKNELPSDQQKAPAMSAAQGAGNIAIAQTARPPEPPTNQIPPTPGKSVSAGVRVK